MKHSILAICAAGSAAVAAVAAAAVLTSSSPRHPSPTAAPAQAGMMIAIDPETGALGMPSPEQRQALEASELARMNQSQEGLVEVHHPDGSVSIDLQGRFQEYAMVRIGADGRKTFTCVDDPAAAMQAADTPVPADRPAPPATAPEVR